MLKEISDNAIQEACIDTENVLLDPITLMEKGCYKIERMKGTLRDLIVVTNTFRYNTIFLSIDSLDESKVSRLENIFDFIFPSEKYVNDASLFSIFQKYFNKALLGGDYA